MAKGSRSIQTAWMENKCTRIGHAFTGLMKCGGKILDSSGQETDQSCGCAVTAEIQPKKQKDGSIKEHLYWRCSNTTTKCSQRDKRHMQALGLKMYCRQEVIESMLEEMFSRLHFTEEDCKWMQESLIQHHSEESLKHGQKQSALHSHLKMLNRYIDESYTDKLEGTLSEEVWRQKNQQWVLEREEINRELSAMDDRKQEYIEKGVLLIELAQRTVSIYKNAKPEIKRKLIDIVSLNLVLANGTIEYHYRKPFDILADSSKDGKVVDQPEYGTNTPYFIDKLNVSLSARLVNPKEIQALYQDERLSAAQIAQRLRVSKSFVLSRLHAFGIREDKVPKRYTSPENYRCPSPPFGYSVVGRKLVPNKTELRVCHAIVELILRNGMSSTATAKELSRRGLKNRVGKTSWSHGSVLSIYRRWKDKL